MLDEHGRRRSRAGRRPDVVGEELLSFGLLSGLLPVAGGEIEDAALGPVGEQAHDLAQELSASMSLYASRDRERRDRRIVNGEIAVVNAEIGNVNAEIAVRERRDRGA
jgi:hypothetical protein